MTNQNQQNTPYKFPISTYIGYDFILNENITFNFMNREILLAEKNELNLDYWDLIRDKEREISLCSGEDVKELSDEEKDVLELLEDLDEDTDEKIEEYKGKKDLEKLLDIIKYIEDASLEEVQYMIFLILNDNYNIETVAIHDKKVNKNIRYILNEYTSLKNDIKNDEVFKSLIRKINTLDNENKIAKTQKELKTYFINFFSDLAEQIKNFNLEKDNIIKMVYLAKKGDEKAKEEIIGKVIFKEAEKIVNRYVYKINNKTYAEKEQIKNDLLQEAILSSITGLEKYDINKSDNFVFYIRYWIKQGIHKGLEEQYNEIKIPSYIIQLFSKIKNIHNHDGETDEKDIDYIVNELTKENIKKYDKKIKELKGKLKKTKGKEFYKIENEIELLEEAKTDPANKENLRKKVKMTLERIKSNSVHSISSILKNLDNDTEQGGMEANILIDESSDISQNFKKEEQKKELKRILKNILSPKEYFVFKHEYGLGDADELLLNSRGKILKIAAERVRQIRDNVAKIMSQERMDRIAKHLSRTNPFLLCDKSHDKNHKEL